LAQYADNPTLDGLAKIAPDVAGKLIFPPSQDIAALVQRYISNTHMINLSGCPSLPDIKRVLPTTRLSGNFLGYNKASRLNTGKKKLKTKN
jgi:hypothetical protein